DVTCINADAVPRRLQFLVPGMTFVRTDEALANSIDYAAVFVDSADQARPGDRLRARFPKPVGNIDHHLSNIGYAEINLVDSGSAATCEMLAGLALDHGLAIDAQAANAFYAGILTDTGQFRFASTSQRCFRIAAELLERGAHPPEVGFELYERESIGKLLLLQHYLASLRLECGGRVCIGTLPAGVFDSTGSTAEDTEGLVDYARSVDGVDVGVLIEERNDGSVKASLRAKDAAFRLDQIAAQFNGGGHACAAGLNLKQGAENFRARLIAALAKQIEVVDAQKGRP
ncbi:MAG: phosphoesterase RecJ domain protein, partial [Verrucomicrobia bacterium]|nr:phosphoesterase RecJ domain protein [Verrucomicrobiota bacterium]